MPAREGSLAQPMTERAREASLARTPLASSGAITSDDGVARARDLAALLVAPLEGRALESRPSIPQWLLPANWTPREAAACADKMTHSQFMEDLALLPTLLAAAASLGGRRRPRFVELGALDGTSLSNTFMLERCFNWTGTLIEANPASYERLVKSNRAARKVHSAVCASGGGGRGDGGGAARTVRMVARAGSTTGQVDALTGSQLRKYYGAPANLSEVDFSTVEVPCHPLGALVGAPGHQLLSLDVEGAEAHVLANADPDMFDVIVVEVQDHEKSTRRRIDELILRGGGMRRARELWVPFSTVYVSRRIQEVPVAHRFVRTRRGKHSQTLIRTTRWQELS